MVESHPSLPNFLFGSAIAPGTPFSASLDLNFSFAKRNAPILRGCIKSVKNVILNLFRTDLFRPDPAIAGEGSGAEEQDRRSG
jgi:hypothetical protein